MECHILQLQGILKYSTRYSHYDDFFFGLTNLISAINVDKYVLPYRTYRLEFTGGQIPAHALIKEAVYMK